jgi:predicted 3-demethylubiquinone-9 3-methyltransferase (glyoxalase superfamily)
MEPMTPKSTVCLWFERDALQAPHFYATTIPDGSFGALMQAPGDLPDG